MIQLILPEDFTVPEHRLMWEYIGNATVFIDEGLAWNIARTMRSVETGALDATLAERCCAALEAAELAARMDDGDSITPEFAAHLLRASSVLRNLQRTALPILTQSYEASPLEHADLIRRLHAATERATQQMLPAGPLSPARASEQWQARRAILGQQAQSSSGETLVAHPINAISEPFGEWRRKAIYVVGGGSGNGKSSLLGLIAHNIAANGFRTLVFSLEYASEVTLERLVCQLSGVRIRRDGQYTQQERERMDRAGESMPDMLELIDHDALGGASHWDAIRQHIWAEHRKQPIDAIVIDYYQDVKPGPKDDRKYTNDAVWLRDLSQSIRRMAQKLNCAVFLAAVLTDEHERSKDKPGLSSIKFSRQLGADAWGVMLLHAEKQDADARKLANLRDRREMTLVIAKSRSGPLGEHAIAFRPSTMTFEDAHRAQDQRYS